MAVLKSRTRLVTFRLSNDEYDQLKKVCVAAGSRSISDFARSAVLDRVQTQQSSRALLTEDLLTLGRGLEELDSALKELSERIERVLGGSERSRVK